MKKPSCFSDILRNERKNKKLTLRQLSEILGISYSSLGKYERGEYEPDIKTLISIANYFDVSVDYLLGLTTIKNYKTLNNLYNKNIISRIEDSEIKYEIEMFLFKTISLIEPFYNTDIPTSMKILCYYTELIKILIILQRESIKISNRMIREKKYSEYEAEKDLKILFYDFKEEINELLTNLLIEYNSIYICNK